MHRLLMIMGYQRSGTNALFHSFAKAGGCVPFLDVERSEIYDQYCLRPETEIRTILTSQSKPALLKPVEETKKRDINSVFAEYHNYDLRVLYIYRDPVNSFFSQTEMWPQFTDVPEFIHLWNKRNRYALDVAPEWMDRFAIVKYQDLSEDPGVFDQARAFFGVPGTYLFRPDKNRGRTQLDPKIQRQIDEETRGTLNRLDAARSFLPRKSPFSIRKIFRTTRFLIVEQLRKLKTVR